MKNIHSKFNVRNQHLNEPLPEMCIPERCARNRTGRGVHSECGSRGIDSDTKVGRR